MTGCLPSTCTVRRPAGGRKRAGWDASGHDSHERRSGWFKALSSRMASIATSSLFVSVPAPIANPPFTSRAAGCFASNRPIWSSKCAFATSVGDVTSSVCATCSPPPGTHLFPLHGGARVSPLRPRPSPVGACTCHWGTGAPSGDQARSYRGRQMTDRGLFPFQSEGARSRAVPAESDAQRVGSLIRAYPVVRLLVALVLEGEPERLGTRGAQGAGSRSARATMAEASWGLVPTTTSAAPRPLGADDGIGPRCVPMRLWASCATARPRTSSRTVPAARRSSLGWRWLLCVVTGGLRPPALRDRRNNGANSGRRPASVAPRFL